jgi:hypothetical protein
MAVNDSMDVDHVDSTSSGEVDAMLTRLWAHRGPLYGMYSVSLQLDYAPDFAKLSRWASDLYGSGGPEYAVVVQSCQNIHSYMMLGWETGLRNEFETLWRNGMSRQQLMELVMFSQMYAGMRGLGHVYHAVGDFLPMMAEPGRELVFPPGWAPDPGAFRAGLDLDTRELTAADEAAITLWYEQTIGYVPASVRFGMKRDPRFLKLNRARWERALVTLPKQLAPYLMLRHHTITQSVQGLREAALLGRAWGLTQELIIRAVTNTAMYFTGTEGMYAAYEVLEPIFDDWEEGA